MLLDWFFIHLTKSCGETFQMKNLSVVLLRIPFSFCIVENEICTFLSFMLARKSSTTALFKEIMVHNVYTVVTGNFSVWLHNKQINIIITIIISNLFSFVNSFQKDFQAII